MPIRVACPSCSAPLSAPDAAAGRTVKCPKCQTPMALPDAPAPVAAPAVAKAVRKPAVVARPVPAPVEDDRPRKRSRPADDDEDDEEEDDRPRRKSAKKGKSLIVKVLGVIFGIILLLVPLARVAKIILIQNRIEERERNAQAVPEAAFRPLSPDEIKAQSAKAFTRPASQPVPMPAVPNADSKPASVDEAFSRLLGRWKGTGRDEKAKAKVVANLTVTSGRLRMEWRLMPDSGVGQMLIAQPYQVVGQEMAGDELVLKLRIDGPSAPNAPVIDFRCRFEPGAVNTRFMAPNGTVIEIRYTK